MIHSTPRSVGHSPHQGRVKEKETTVFSFRSITVCFVKGPEKPSYFLLGRNRISVAGDPGRGDGDRGSELWGNSVP